MLQHVLIGDLAPLCLLAGLSGPLLRPLLALRPVERLRVLAHPLVALPIWAANLYLWHLPVLYEGAVAHSAVHALEHVCFFTAGVIVWLPVLETLPAPEWFGTGPKLAYIAAVRVVETVLGNVFVWSGTVFYGVYAHGDGALGRLPAPRPGARRRGDDDRGVARHDRGARVALPAAGAGGRAAPGAARARARPACGPARRPLRPRAGACRPALNSVLPCARAACTTSTWSSPRSSAACPSTATCSARSASTGSARSRASAARRSGTSAGRAARSGIRKAAERSAGSTATALGLHHLAFEAVSRAVVDERHDWLVGVGRGDRDAAARVQLHARLLRGLLLRPGRDQARDRPRGRPGRVGLLEGDGRGRALDLQLRDAAHAIGAARVEDRDRCSLAASSTAAHHHCPASLWRT